MGELYRLARLGNMQEIVAQAGRLASLDERYRPFADRLISLAKGYQSKAVLRLVEGYLQHDASVVADSNAQEHDWKNRHEG